LSSESARIGEAQKVPFYVLVGTNLPCLGIPDLEDPLAARHAADKNPEPAVDGPAVDDLDDELQVVGREKPEGAGRAGQRDGLAVSAPAGVNRPILFPLSSANQIFPSDPTASPAGPLPAARANSSIRCAAAQAATSAIRRPRRGR
jgi:hypothetical protein